MATPWEVDTAVYEDKYKNISAQEGNPYGVSFSSDGSKMYIVGTINDTVYQYTLSTPWDVDTASYAEKLKDVSTQGALPIGIDFSFDGSKMYVLGSSVAYQYTLSTPWDVSTASYAEKSKNVSTEESSTQGMTFSSDGSKMYISGYNNQTVYQYTLSTPWDVSTASYAEKSKNVSTEGRPFGIAFSPNGTKMYIMGWDVKKVFQYSLSTAWDVSTASYADKFKDTSAQGSAPQDVAFSSDGSKMYVMEYNSDTVYQYTLSVLPIALISTAAISVSTVSALSRGITEPLLSTANIAISITSSLSRGIKESLISTANIAVSIIANLTKKGIALISTATITISTTSSLSRGIKEALTSTSAITTSMTGRLTRIVNLISTFIITTSIVSTLSRGITETLTSTSAITTSITSSLSRGIKAVLNSTVNITTSTVSALSRGITQSLASTANIVLSIVSTLTAKYLWIWIKVKKEKSYPTKVDKETSDWTKIDKEKGDWEKIEKE